MATYTEAIKKLEYLERLVKNPSSFTSEDIKEKPSDTPLIKSLKKTIRGEDVKDRDGQITRLGQEINDKQNEIDNKQVEVNNLNTDKTNLTNEKTQLTNELTTKRGEITTLQTQSFTTMLRLTNTQNDLTTARTEITNKDNRIAQLDQAVKDSALIFQTQINIIDGLTQQLQQAQQQNLGNADYQTHLKADIKRLAQERKDLVKQKKDLEDTKTASENLRDTEIAGLRTERDSWTTTFIGKTPTGVQTELNTVKTERDTARANTTNALQNWDACLKRPSAVLLPELVVKVSAMSNDVLVNQATEIINKLNQIRTERDNRPNITLAEWTNDWSKRPPRIVEPPQGWDDTTTSLTITEANKDEYLTDKEWGLARFRKLTGLNLRGVNKTSYKLENVLPNSLQTLDCYNSKITSLPELPNSLKTLQCYNTQLTSLPALPSSLTTLQCYNTQLTSLPALPSSLIQLYCYNTQLTSLPALPSSLTTLQCFNTKNSDIGFVGYNITGNNNTNINIPGKELKQTKGAIITNITFQPRTTPISYLYLNDNRYSPVKLKINNLTNYWQGTGFLATVKPYLYNENNASSYDVSKTFLEWHNQGNSYV